LQNKSQQKLNLIRDSCFLNGTFTQFLSWRGLSHSAISMPSLSAKASQGTNEISIMIKLPWSHLLEMMWNKYVSEVFVHAQSREPNLYSFTLQAAGNWR
jgi:hypothetical protein